MHTYFILDISIIYRYAMYTATKYTWERINEETYTKHTRGTKQRWHET